MLQGRIQGLEQNSQCADYKGSGSARFKLAGNGHAHVQATVNGADAGDFLVDTGATFVTMSKRLADKVGVLGPYIDIVATTANGKASAQLGQVDSLTVGNLRAKHVDVAVQDGVGNESLLGMSFLSRFDMHLGSGSLTISQRTGGKAQQRP
jgi:aspartyl protease family protein